MSQHIAGKVHTTEAGSLGADEAAAELDALASEHARELVRDPLVLPEHVPDLATANTNIAGRYVRVRTNVAEQFSHETLAKPHYLCVGLALGLKIGSTGAAAQWQGGQGIFKYLLKRQKF